MVASAATAPAVVPLTELWSGGLPPLARPCSTLAVVHRGPPGPGRAARAKESLNTRPLQVDRDAWQTRSQALRDATVGDGPVAAELLEMCLDRLSNCGDRSRD
jgi:hypothetical protein